MLKRVLGRRILSGLCLLLVGATLTSTTTFAADEGADLAWKYHCTTCHGVTGKSNAQRYPNLAGQNSIYLVSRLKYFRDGVEPGNQMNAQAAPLSDETIEVLAEYFSRQSN
jgi:cytochrome c553